MRMGISSLAKIQRFARYDNAYCSFLPYVDDCD